MPNPWLSWFKQSVALLIVLFTFRLAVADWNVVPSGSMKPTIVEGDRILVDKLAYGLNAPFVQRPLLEWCNPKRNDVVVFRSPTDGTLFVKRVIGVPGDHIALRDNRLFVDRSKLPTSFLIHGAAPILFIGPGRALFRHGNA